MSADYDRGYRNGKQTGRMNVRRTIAGLTWTIKSPSWYELLGYEDCVMIFYESIEPHRGWYFQIDNQLRGPAKSLEEAAMVCAENVFEWEREAAL